MAHRLLWPIFGVIAAAVGMAVAHAVAAAVDISTSPVLSVGSAVIDLTPTPAKEWAIRTFGTKDKAVLVGSVLVAATLLSATAGLAARRRLRYGLAILGALVGAAAVAVAVRPAAAPADLVPSLTGAVVALGALTVLARARAADQRAGGRRGVLIAALALSVVGVSSAGTGRLLTRLRLRQDQVDLPAATDPAPVLPRGLDDQVPDVTPFRTANRDFYRVDTRLDVPILGVDDWTLTIDGDVERTVVLRFDDLLRMPMIERDITLTCVSNSVGGPYVGAARWLGVRLTDVLALAGVGSRADQLLSTDFDGMTISTPLALATDGRDALVCVGMNGVQLPREHGFPVRMVVPGLYGFISATKWLTRLTLTSYAEQEAYWTRRGWATDAPIKASARIDTPRGLARLDPGEVVIGGVAWAQADGGVAGVQVRVDGGPWQDAHLGPDGGNAYWRQWFHRWDAGPGSHTLAARAIDGAGRPQTAVRAEPFPAGASGIHQLFVDVG